MSPTTEGSRIFHVLRKNGDALTYRADTICDVNGHGTYLRFKRDGEVVGEAQGDMLAWWIENGDSGKTYWIELPGGHSVSIVADSKDRQKDSPTPREIFRRGNEIVATIYIDYHTWSVEG